MSNVWAVGIVLLCILGTSFSIVKSFEHLHADFIENSKKHILLHGVYVITTVLCFCGFLFGMSILMMNYGV